MPSGFTNLGFKSNNRQPTMTPSNFPTEGRQFVIPGAERITPKKRQSFKAEGRQLVIPGADPVSIREHLTRMMMKPIKPRRRQIGLAGTGLFKGP